MHFYPRPLRGGRHKSDDAATRIEAISIHALCEEGDILPTTRTHSSTNFYPRPLRGGRLSMRLSLCLAPTISIHALCEEGDFWLVIGHHLLTISIHALCEEGDAFMVSLTFCRLLFLSTPSARRATAAAVSRKLLTEHFYPRPLRGGRLLQHCRVRRKREFLSTPSARRATLEQSKQTCKTSNFYPRPLRGGRHGCYR